MAPESVLLTPMLFCQPVKVRPAPLPRGSAVLLRPLTHRGVTSVCRISSPEASPRSAVIYYFIAVRPHPVSQLGFDLPIAGGANWKKIPVRHRTAAFPGIKTEGIYPRKHSCRRRVGLRVPRGALPRPRWAHWVRGATGARGSRQMPSGEPSVVGSG